MVLADLCLFGVAIVSDSLALPPQRNMVFKHHLWHVLTPFTGIGAWRQSPLPLGAQGTSASLTTDHGDR